MEKMFTPSHYTLKHSHAAGRWRCYINKLSVGSQHQHLITHAFDSWKHILETIQAEMNKLAFLYSISNQ